MRIITFILSSSFTIALIFLLDNKWGSIPALGKFLSPQQGFWQNAEPSDHNFGEQLHFKNLQGRVNVYLDERLVPHIFAEQDRDAYFVQGFLHAKFRLWQMEFQTMAAAGRISEILGSDARFMRFDREQRRLGMVYAAELAVQEMEKEPVTKYSNDAYTAGVNAYINSLTESTLPIEYKLLGYKPEPWSNLKIALFLKMMSKDLSGFERDLEFTNAKSVFSVAELRKLFPQRSDSLIPIIPKGTAFAPPGLVPVKPASADSIYLGFDTTVSAHEFNKPDRDNGSNSWAVNGTKSASGAPILCNDPHLGLSLPSIWYEMQINTPTMNVYGATFPGSPSVIIGFNDSLAFGFTNAQRDVKDYFQIKFKDDSKKEYWFDSAWQLTKLRVEQIKVRGTKTINDTVAYTFFGPVMFDNDFVVDETNNTALAVRWTAHDPSNEGLMWMKLNRAKNYNDYEQAIKTFVCPGQNMLIATKSGDIALWQQARFPARWRGQGLYILPGSDTTFAWQGFIPQEENPHIINPASGYIQSANQRPVDSTYPYFIPGNYISARGITIDKRLQAMQGITPQQMMTLQNDYYNSIAAMAVPLFLKYIQVGELNEREKAHLEEIRGWDFNATAESKATTIYQTWMDSLKEKIWNDEFSRVPNGKERPDEQTLLEILLKDSAFRFIDNINTSDTETIRQQVTTAFMSASQALNEVAPDSLAWWKHKRPVIYHLLKNSLMPFARTGLQAGGWGNTINAIKVTHGPSWRMIVHLTRETEAFGIYPGGQSGNPGSRFYDNFIDNWVIGKYFSLWMMKAGEKDDDRVKWTMSFSNI
jgi:penicillin amidase